MKLRIEQVVSAMGKVQKFAQDVKQAPGVMLDVQEDSMMICYSDGKKSLVEVVDVEFNEGEVGRGCIIVHYKQFYDIVNSLQASGLKTDDLEFNLTADKSIEISANCYIESKTDEVDEDGNGLSDMKLVNHIRDEIKYYDVDEDKRFGIVTRFDYKQLLKLEEYDEWDRVSLQDILNRLSKEDQKVCYVGSQIKAGFVSNRAYVTYIPTQMVENYGFTLPTKVAKYVVDILGKMTTESVNVHLEDKKYCRMVADDGRCGIWFEIAPAKSTDKGTLFRYQNLSENEERKYDKYELAITRLGFINAIKRAMNSDKNDTTALTFEMTDGKLSIDIKNGNASKGNDNKVIVDGYRFKEDNITELSMPISLKVWYDIISNCVSDFVFLGVDTLEDGGSLVRITDSQGANAESGEMDVKAYYYTTSR